MLLILIERGTHRRLSRARAAGQRQGSKAEGLYIKQGFRAPLSSSWCVCKQVQSPLSRVANALCQGLLGMGEDGGEPCKVPWLTEKVQLPAPLGVCVCALHAAVGSEPAFCSRVLVPRLQIISVLQKNHPKPRPKLLLISPFSPQTPSLLQCHMAGLSRCSRTICLDRSGGIRLTDARGRWVDLPSLPSAPCH